MSVIYKYAKGNLFHKVAYRYATLYTVTKKQSKLFLS